MTDLPFSLPEPNPTVVVKPPRKCYRHNWYTGSLGTDYPVTTICTLCGKERDPIRSRRNKNNGKRGRSDEAKVAAILGGRKVGPLGLPWDVEVEGYMRAQAKQLDSWPSLNAVISWLDAIPQGPELRAVTLADTPGAGRRTRRLIVLDLEDFARFHGKG